MLTKFWRVSGVFSDQALFGYGTGPGSGGHFPEESDAVTHSQITFPASERTGGDLGSTITLRRAGFEASGAAAGET